MSLFLGEAEREPAEGESSCAKVYTEKAGREADRDVTSWPGKIKQGKAHKHSN